MFDAPTYSARRDELRKQVREGLILFPGNKESPVNFAANPYPFRQDSCFLYYFGVDFPDLWGILDADSGTDLLFGSDSGLEARIWTGDRPALNELAAAAGASVGGTVGALESCVRAAGTGGRSIHYLPPYRADQILELSLLIDCPPDAVRNAFSEDLVRSVVAMRSRKIPEEIAEVESALVWTGELFATVATELVPGKNILEIAGALDKKVREWSTRPAFPMIMTVRGEVLHAETADTLINPSDLVLVDMGVESPRCYASDVTRTFPASGRFSSDQKDVYRVVLGAQGAAIAAVGPGVPFVDVHLKAAHEIARGLIDMGLMKGDPAEAVAEGAHALFFPTGLGHLLGLDVHDMENLGEDAVGYDDEIRRDTRFGLSALRFGRRLDSGHLLTIEPGIYFIPALIERWASEKRFVDFIDYRAVERFREFGGVRVEDDVLVTDTGCRILGPPIPKAIETVEAVVGRRP